MPGKNSNKIEFKKTMRKLKLCLYVILCFFLCSSINATEVSNSKNVSLETLIDQNWHSILENSKIKMRDAWLAHNNPINDFPKQKYGNDYYYFSSETELKQFELVPVEHFKMDSLFSVKMSVESSFPIENLLSIRTDMAHFYAFKGDTILYIVSLKFMNNQWSLLSYGPIDKKLSEVIAHLYFTKKIKAFFVNVENSSKLYLVYIEDGRFMNLNYGGSCTPFKDVLLNESRTIKPAS